MNANCREILYLGDPKVQAALGEEMLEARMSFYRNSKHQEYLGIHYSNRIRQGRCPKCRKEMIDSIGERQGV